MTDHASPGKRARLLSKTARRYLQVPIPEIGESIRIRSLTERERSSYEMEAFLTKGTDYEARVEDSRRRLVMLVAVEDDSDDLLFSPLDKKALEQVDSIVTSTVYDAALVHCGIQRRDIEELVKNSIGTDAGKLPTGSPNDAA